MRYLNGHWVYRRSDFKTSLFKHHDGCVVDTGSCEKPDSRRLKGTELCELCPNPHEVGAHLSQLRGQTATRHGAKTTALTTSYLWWFKDKHKVTLALDITTHTYPLEISIWEALSCHSHDPSTWKQHKEVMKTISWLHKYLHIKPLKSFFFSTFGQYIKCGRSIWGEDVILLYEVLESSLRESLFSSNSPKHISSCLDKTRCRNSRRLHCQENANLS